MYSFGCFGYRVFNVLVYLSLASRVRPSVGVKRLFDLTKHGCCTVGMVVYMLFLSILLCVAVIGYMSSMCLGRVDMFEVYIFKNIGEKMLSRIMPLFSWHCVDVFFCVDPFRCFDCVI